MAFGVKTAAGTVDVPGVDLVRQGPLKLADFIALMKPRVMSLVIFTGLVGAVAAPGPVDYTLLFWSLVCMAAGAGACGALNMWYDADIDAMMRRTERRPLPGGRVTESEALIIGGVMSTLSVAVLAYTVNFIAAALLALTIVYYVVFYTMGLKRRTTQNIVIGGAAGAFPPLIGWAAMTGGLDLGAAALFLIVFLWTPPHFWALAIARQADYSNAGVPMLPCVAGARHTSNQILVYSVLLVASTFAPSLLGTAGPGYTLSALGLNAVLMWRAIELWRLIDDDTRKNKAAMRLFGYSIVYLFALYLALLIFAL